MAEFLIRSAEPGDVDALVARMRQADRDECAAAGVTQIGFVVHWQVASAEMCWSAHDEQGLVSVFGASEIADGVGSPWMLATDLFDKHRRDLVREVPPYLGRMLERFPRLINFVYEKNAVSIRWLKRIGFQVEPAIPFGPLGSLFHPFHMEA